jgi:hypothetical protein
MARSIFGRSAIVASFIVTAPDALALGCSPVWSLAGFCRGSCTLVQPRPSFSLLQRRPLVPPTLSSYPSLSESASACQLYFPRTSKSLPLSLSCSIMAWRQVREREREDTKDVFAYWQDARVLLLVTHFTQKTFSEERKN